MKNLFLFPLFIFLLSACQAPIKKVDIDNPSTNTITLLFDDDEPIVLAPGETKTVELQFGKRKLKVNSESVEEINLLKEYDYLINPSKATYYEEEMHYFANQAAQKKYERDHLMPKSEVEGVEVNGAFRKIENKLLIKNTWQFGVGQDVTEEIRLGHANKKEHYAIKKLHRATDLSALMRKNLLEYMKENRNLPTE